MPTKEVQIDFKKFEAMLDRLGRRISQRFTEGSEPGIHERMQELLATTSSAPSARQRITSPLWMFRLVLTGVIVFLGYMGYLCAGEIKLSFKDSTLSDILQAADSAMNLGLAVVMVIVSMFLLERSWKRSIAIRYMDQLIALGLVINVAQMAKDPERLTYGKEQATEASPDLGGCTSSFLLGRWLDYANEMVGVLPTLAAYVSAGVTDGVIQAKKAEVQSVADYTSANLRQKALTLATLFPAKQKEEPVSAS